VLAAVLARIAVFSFCVAAAVCFGSGTASGAAYGLLSMGLAFIVLQGMDR
jgi:hypothetical protein